MTKFRKTTGLAMTALALSMIGCTVHDEQAAVPKAPKREGIAGVTIVSDRTSGMTYLVTGLEVSKKTAMKGGGGRTTAIATPKNVVLPEALVPANAIAEGPVGAIAATAAVRAIAIDVGKLSASLEAAAPMAIKAAALDSVAEPIERTDVIAVVKSSGTFGTQLKVDYALDSWTQVYFAYGASNLGPHARAVLTRAAVGKEGSDRVLVAALADPSGDAAKNKVLVAKRGVAVKQYLVEKGIPSGRISVKTALAATTAAGNKRALGALADGAAAQGMAEPANAHAKLRKAEVAFFNKPAAQGE